MSRWPVFFLLLLLIGVVYVVAVRRTVGFDGSSSGPFLLFLGVVSLVLLLVLVAGNRLPR
ncbi:hypothetical protein OV203_38525 [Nannocystis sp. ILAH1]|uniref:hypothetical protein n=1 Tax=Nannocystis sp. ILAH1 TaxID=2996789 RepID=UPI0022713FE4|nr:hypothetical protein [Nannocystis sp. ILAH1]MCY0993100.1 hypothetical protein [Nannocystis sp. ILAH1]